MTQTYHASAGPIEWNFTVPPAGKRGKLQLLTIGGISVPGAWYGDLGQYFVAWHELVKYDQNKFDAVLNAYKSQNPSNVKDNKRCH